MQLKRLDHVNVRTAGLQGMIDWYGDALGMRPGPRPDFGFGGAWLYCDGRPIVHLVEVASPPRAKDPRLEHFAISAEGLEEFLAHLRGRKVPYKLARIADFGIVQVNVWDPDDNHIHIDFAAAEASRTAELGDYDGG
jgi:catechol 2,3-dioxygenase-like lactoylglutathione lyase family enzyme